MTPAPELNYTPDNCLGRATRSSLKRCLVQGAVVGTGGVADVRYTVFCEQQPAKVPRGLFRILFTQLVIKQEALWPLTWA